MLNDHLRLPMRLNIKAYHENHCDSDKQRHLLGFNEKENSLSEHDRQYLRRAIQLAIEAEGEGNLPVGAVIVLDGEIISEGKNAIWIPALDATRHAEIEALRSVPSELWDHAAEMTLYTTLEPCVMCLGAILLHGVGRVVFGSSDDYGGAGCVVVSLPQYFREKMNSIQWVGPVLADECDPLHKRLLELEADRR